MPDGMRLDRQGIHVTFHDLRNLHEILIPSLGLPYAFQVIVERLLTRFLWRL